MPLETDEEAAPLVRLLNGVIDGDRYPVSPRVSDVEGHSRQADARASPTSSLAGAQGFGVDEGHLRSETRHGSRLWGGDNFALRGVSPTAGQRRQDDVIISRKYRFIFIKGVKVAGTSIEIALSRLCRDTDDIVTPITAIDELLRLRANGDGARNYSGNPEAERAYLDGLQRAPVSQLPDIARLMRPSAIYFNHMSLREVLLLQGPVVSSYRVVFAERNPYAKILSWLNHQLTAAAYQIGGGMQTDASDLREYIARAFNAENIIRVKNIDLYCNLSGIFADMIRFEHLHEDLEHFFQSLGAHYHPSMLPHAKKGILANNLDPLDFLDREKIQVVNDVFREEFEAFNYQML